MNDCMTFPDTVEEFMEQYKITDTKQVYTNGIEFVPIFRMKQWFEHLPSAQPEPCEELDFVQEHKKIPVVLDIQQKEKSTPYAQPDLSEYSDKLWRNAYERGKAEAEQRWIPVSERLPKIGEEVLLSEPNAMLIAEYHGSGNAEGLWVVDECHHYLADVNKCAWMPLPEPYREEGEQDG